MCVQTKQRRIKYSAPHVHMDSRKIHFGNLKDKNKLKITKSKEENINTEKVWLKSENTKIGKEILKYKTKVHQKSKKKKVTINKF